MKITILGSCRQHSIKDIAHLTSISEDISYPHYTKEILQMISFCKYGDLTPSETLYTFRTPILTKNPIVFNESLMTEFNTTDLYVIEISSKKSYTYDNKYLHHIALEDEYDIPIKNEISIRIQTKDEIEEDVIKINEILEGKIIIVSHLVTLDSGDRYLLRSWLKEICNKHNIVFIDPIEELKKKCTNIDDLFVKEDILAHYNQDGHNEIKQIYSEFISQFVSKK